MRGIIPGKSPASGGQGLVEYALILMLVALVVMLVLALIGPQVGNVFSQVRDGLAMNSSGAGPPPVVDIVAITLLEYDSAEEELHIHATSDGGADAAVTLTASPGGDMELHVAHNHYHKKYTLSGCPCTVTVSSNMGGSATVTVGP